MFLVTLFTGLRRDDHDQQAVAARHQGWRSYHLVSTKNSKGRIIAPASYVMKLLRAHRRKQSDWRRRASPLWADSGLVFTNELGARLSPYTVCHHYKRIVESIGLPLARFHDLRHSYAVAAIRSGDDIKTVQGTWATLRRPLRWTYTATSPSR